MKRHRFAIGACVLLVWAGVLVRPLPVAMGDAGASSQPSTTSVATTSPATSPSQVDTATEAKRLRVAGIECALAGRISEGSTLIAQAETLDPDNAGNTAALELISDYLARSSVFEAQRAAEYEREVRRVSQAMAAYEYLPRLTQAKLDEPLHEKVSEIIAAYNHLGNSDSLKATTDNEAEELKTEAGKNVDSLIELVEQAVHLLKDDRSPYAEMFGSLAKEFCVRLVRYRDAWAAAEIDDVCRRRASARKLREMEMDIEEALSDLGSAGGAEPWRRALAHAALAKRIAPAGEEPSTRDWYRKLVSEVEKLGDDAVQDARWYDALHAYRGLAELDPDSQSYEDMVGKVSRHARVLSLYGKTPDKADDEVESVRRHGYWEDMIDGIDVEMVRNAISQLDENYVRAVDYRKLTRGALMSLKILAETPQAAESFPTLKDDEKRKAFVESIDGQLAGLDKIDRVDHLSLQLELNSVLLASRRTVDLPVGVVAMEFADGFLDQLDKFSAMIWPKDLGEFEKHTLGHFFGIGVQITKEPGRHLKVVTPLANSPALKAGIKTRDLIVAVDGLDTKDLSLNKLVEKIQGKKGTRVTLRILRPGLANSFDVDVVRDEVRINTVNGWNRQPRGAWDFMIDPAAKIGYIRLTQFTSKTHSDLAKAIRRLRQAGSRSIIIDVRFNPGGLLKSATAIADELLRTGVIVSTRGRQTRRSESKATGGGSYVDGDLVVLINRFSASASEVLGGALQDWRRGIIIGERSYGKGSVQNLIPLRGHRAMLKLTTAYYYLPHGRLLHRQNGSKTWGVDPDIEVLVTPAQRKRWLAIRRDTDLIQDIDRADLRTDLAEQYAADMQLQTAVLLLKLMQLQGDEPAVADAR